MAQLPHLIYDQRPPMSCESFKTLAESQLPKKDAALFKFLSLSPDFCEKRKSGCSFIDNWYKWDNSLRLNLAKQRTIKLKREVTAAEPPDYHMDAAAAAIKAVDEDSPLEAEILLDKARWHAIENLAGNDYFHRNTVFAYYLKLMLIERREAFNVDKGFAEYKTLYASILDDFESMQNAGDHK